jgi:DNA-binding transcriptional MocR family regulator
VIVMTRLADMNAAELQEFHARARADYDALKARGITLDMTRGKPSAEQLDLSNELLRLPGNGDWHQADGGDTRNYFGSIQGLPEARALFSGILGAPPEQVLIGNNASLALMHDCIVFALLKGVPDGTAPWTAGPAKFICPAPGYDRHFAICEEYGIEMLTVPLTGEGPDMDAVEDLAADPAVKGMWGVPQYSNPTAETYAPETVERLAAMKTGAPDFRLFWDNAYASHHLTGERPDLLNILETCAAAGNPNRAFVFASTSKMTFAGGGLSMFASSPENMKWFCARLSKRTIGPDKLNQLRHVRFLKDQAGIDRLMEGHRRLLAPKFEAVDRTLAERIGDTGAAVWTKPKGGYFISVDTIDGCAKRVVALAGEAGLTLVPAGATFPYGKDPRDRNLRLAPSFPSVAEVTTAADAVSTCILLAASERLLADG